MAVDLGEYADVLDREINPPGSSVISLTEEQLTAYLADAFWEARLDGFLASWTADVTGMVEPVKEGGEDLPRDQVALIVLYAGIRILRNVVLNTSTRFSAKAGPVEFETQNSATVLSDMLDILRETKARLLEEDVASSVALIDGLTVRSLSPGAYGGYLADLYAGI